MTTAKLEGYIHISKGGAVGDSIRWSGEAVCKKYNAAQALFDGPVELVAITTSHDYVVVQVDGDTCTVDPFTDADCTTIELDEVVSFKIRNVDCRARAGSIHRRVQLQLGQPLTAEELDRAGHELREAARLMRAATR